MKPSTLLVLLLVLPTPLARADERVVRKFTADDFGPALSIPIGDDNNGGDTLAGMRNDKEQYGSDTSQVGLAVVDAVEPTSDGTPRTVTVLTLDTPPVTQDHYWVSGTVKYAGVEGQGYLELWNDFPDGGHYFSRTTGKNGPMQGLSGDSASRPFLLPFNSRGERPSKLTLNVVLPGRGRVELTNLKLVEDAGATTAAATPPGSVAEPAFSVLSVPTDAQLDAEMAKWRAKDLQKLVEQRDQVAMMIPGLQKQNGPDHPLTRRYCAIAAAMDRRVAALGGPPLAGGLLPATQPTAAPASETAGSGDSRVLGALIAQRGLLDKKLQDLEATGSDRPQARALREQLGGLDAQIRALAGTPTPHAGSGGVIDWLDNHFGEVFAILVVGSFVLILPLRWCVRHGRGRAFVTGAFGLMALGGVGVLFAAGVALGLGRPADAWLTLLAGAAVLIVVPVLSWRQLQQQYAGLELRKMRAMDVA